MQTHHPLFGKISQIGYVVDDLEAAARAWSETSAIGPWTRMSGVVMQAVMDGKPSQIEIDVALTYKGDVQMELIKPLTLAPSPYTANQKANLWGLHHVQFTTDDMDAALSRAKAAGLELACEINQGGGVYNYLRGPGIWFELIQPEAPLLAFFDHIKASSQNWDGEALFTDLNLG